MGEPSHQSVKFDTDKWTVGRRPSCCKRID